MYAENLITIFGYVYKSRLLELKVHFCLSEQVIKLGFCKIIENAQD